MVSSFAVNTHAPVISFVTMGCAKNEVDSAKMRQLVERAGYNICSDPNDADAIVINTCCFIQSATEESIDAIFELIGLPRFQKGHIKLIISGCMPARYGDTLCDEISEAVAFLPCNEENKIVEVLANLIGKPSTINNVRCGLIPTAGPYSSYVKISDGCNRFCSYCAIPYIRGRYHSFTYESIENEVFEVVNSGVKEIILIAQDTGKWGTDFEEPSSLSVLMDKLASKFPDIWFRVMYLQPEEITDDLLAVFAHHKNIANYLDIPIQHVDENLLKAMNRQGSAGEFQKLIAHIRNKIPGIVLRTTVIVGFPGETEDMYDELYDFISQGYFDYVGSFSYSQEEGTRAASFDDQVTDDVKIERLQHLRDLIDTVCPSRIKSYEDKVFQMLIEGKDEDGQLFGRLQIQAPEVDGITFVDEGELGAIVPIKITDSLFYDLEGERCD